MTRQEAIDRLADRLAGKFARFAFSQVAGPGLEERLRGLVKEIEKAAEEFYDAVAPKDKK